MRVRGPCRRHPAPVCGAISAGSSVLPRPASPSSDEPRRPRWTSLVAGFASGASRLQTRLSCSKVRLLPCNVLQQGWVNTGLLGQSRDVSGLKRIAFSRKDQPRNPQATSASYLPWPLDATGFLTKHDVRCRRQPSWLLGARASVEAPSRTAHRSWVLYQW